MRLLLTLISLTSAILTFINPTMAQSEIHAPPSSYQNPSSSDPASEFLASSHAAAPRIRGIHNNQRRHRNKVSADAGDTVERVKRSVQNVVDNIGEKVARSGERVKRSYLDEL